MTSLAYRKMASQRIGWLITGITLLVLSILIDLSTGPALLNIYDVFKSFVSPEQMIDPMVYVIVHSIRLPMTMMAIVVGASLGAAGALMQTILGNPLASPYTLGFSAAAGFGAAVTILFGFELPYFPQLSVPFAAFIAASSACALVYGVAQLKGVTAEVMVLSGIATLFLFQSLQSLAQYMASPEVLQEIVFWLFGSMLKASWFSVSVGGAILVFSVLVLMKDSWKLTALRLGDERANSLGVDVKKLRLKVFAVVSLLTAGAVAFVGTIGFIGLVAPHIARMLVGEDHRLLLPFSSITGAVLMVAASIISKIISPGSIVPIGIVTAVVGVPFLFGLILSRKRGN